MISDRLEHVRWPARGPEHRPERLVVGPDLIVDRLRASHVHRAFGYSADGIHERMRSLRRAGEDPAVVQARKEENGVLMVVGHAKYTRGVGAVVNTQGPGWHTCSTDFTTRGSTSSRPSPSSDSSRPPRSASGTWLPSTSRPVSLPTNREWSGQSVPHRTRDPLAVRGGAPHDVQVDPAYGEPRTSTPSSPPHRNGTRREASPPTATHGGRGRAQRRRARDPKTTFVRLSSGPIGTSATSLARRLRKPSPRRWRRLRVIPALAAELLGRSVATQMHLAVSEEVGAGQILHTHVAGVAALDFECVLLRLIHDTVERESSIGSHRAGGHRLGGFPSCPVGSCSYSAFYR